MVDNYKDSVKPTGLKWLEKLLGMLVQGLLLAHLTLVDILHYLLLHSYPIADTLQMRYMIGFSFLLVSTHFEVMID